MSQTTAEREVEPNARYDAIFGTNYAGLDADSARMDELRQATATEAAVLGDLDEEAARYDAYVEEDEVDTLTWDMVSVTENHQMLASICAYFEGVSAGEEVEEIRRKLQTANVEWYVNAFLVVRGVLDPKDRGPAHE